MYHPADLVLTPEHDLAMTEPMAALPEVGETFNVWLYDGARDIGFNIHPRASGGTMDSSVTAFLPDGRIARANYGAPGTFTDPSRPASAHVKLHCIEPFRRWELAVEEVPVYLTSDADQARGTSDETIAGVVSLEASWEPAAPAWINGALLPESRQTTDAMALWMGVGTGTGYSPQTFRYDQLIAGRGEIRFEGRRYAFEGVGLRGHVRGVRRMPGMLGHTWAEGYCAETKRGFGTTMFLRKGGGYVHSEAFLFEDGVMHPARIIHTPHLNRDPEMRDGVFELACDALGLRRILAHDVRAFWWQLPSWGEHGAVRFGRDPAAPVLMKQGITRYTWEDGGDVGYGLNERSG